MPIINLISDARTNQCQDCHRRRRSHWKDMCYGEVTQSHTVGMPRVISIPTIPPPSLRTGPSKSTFRAKLSTSVCGISLAIQGHCRAGGLQQVEADCLPQYRCLSHLIFSGLDVFLRQCKENGKKTVI